jgi:hypothetical protein
MAMEINSKNLHKHAVPLLIIAAAVLVISTVSLRKYQPAISRSLEALIGQKTDSRKETLPSLGDTAKQELGAK